MYIIARVNSTGVKNTGKKLQITDYMLTTKSKVYILDIYNIDYVLWYGSMSQAQSHITIQRAKRKAIAKNGYYYQ